MYMRIFAYTFINLHIHIYIYIYTTCMHMCKKLYANAMKHTSTYRCTYINTWIRINIQKCKKNILLHIHELKHVHGDTPTKLYEYICIKIQMYILTSWVRLVSVDTWGFETQEGHAVWQRTQRRWWIYFGKRKTVSRWDTLVDCFGTGERFV